jgi:hypothetical protein
MTIEPDRELVEFKPKPNYRIKYELSIGDLGRSFENEDIYCPFGDDEAIVRARQYVKEQEQFFMGFVNFRLLGLERLTYETKVTEVVNTTKII